MYLDLIMEFYDEYKDKLRAFVEEGSDSFAMEALKELGRMYRAGTTRRVESKSLSVEARVDLGAGRVLAGELLGGLSDGARAEVEALLLEKKE